MKDKATLTFIVILSLFTTVLLAALIFTPGLKKSQYIELGQLKASQKELTLENEKLRAKIESNSQKWHEIDKEVQKMESELF